MYGLGILHNSGLCCFLKSLRASIGLSNKGIFWGLFIAQGPMERKKITGDFRPKKSQMKPKRRQLPDGFLGVTIFDSVCCGDDGPHGHSERKLLGVC